MKTMIRSSATLLLLISIQASALEADVDDRERVLEEIIVTATLREVRLQDLPLSVGVLTGKQLEDMGAISLDDWWRLIPNLNVRDGAFGGNSVIIRGISDTDSFQSTESINAYYVDDTAMTYVTGLFTTPGDAAMLDVQRVEVLRGPQGTLIGANAMGGAIRVITNDPDPSAPTSLMNLNLSNTEHGGMNFGGSYTLNQPTGDQSAIRLAVLYQDDSGFIDDIGLGRDDINSTQRSAIRLSGLWNPTDNLEVLARIYAENIESSGYNYSDPFGKPWNALPTTDEYQRVLYTPEPRDEDLALASLRLKWQTTWGEVYSATSWYEKDALMDIDWSPELYLFFGMDSQAPFSTDIHQRDFSQEFRISSDGSEAVNWLAGFYYLDQESDRFELGKVPGFFEVILNNQERARREDTAFFGEANWQLRDDITATIGARWYKIDRNLSTVGFFATNSFERSVNGDTSDFVPKASLSWDISEETMVYALYSQGFRPGQFNNAFSVALCGSRILIDSDDLSNYEAGIKTRSTNGRFSLNATVFHIAWNDMQINALDEVCGFVVLDNVGEATSEGLEVDFSWLVNDSFSLEGGFGYNKAELAQAFTDPTVDAPAGTRIPNVPRWTANLAGSWSFQWRDSAEGYLSARVQYVGSRNTLFDQSPIFPLVEKIDDYSLLGLTLGANAGNWRTELFVNNLTDEFAESSCCRTFHEPAVVRPRTVGLRTTYQFQ